jgi:hypothetical protein
MGSKVPTLLSENRLSIDEFRAYLLGINPALIVAIARSGLRLLEVLFRFDEELRQRFNQRLISEKALPFLRLQQIDNIVVLDDLVLFGSTFAEILSDTCKIYGTEAQAISLAVCEESVDPRFKKMLKWFLPLYKDQIDWYCDIAAQAFRTLGKTYDVDHPVFEIHMSNSLRTRAEVISLLNDSGFRFTETTSMSEKENNIFSFCINYIYSPDLLSTLLHPEYISLIGPEKARFQFDLPHGLVTISPICPVRILQQEAHKIIEGEIEGKWFASNYEVLNEPLSQAIEALKRGFFKRGTKLGVSFLQTLTFLLEYILGLSVTKTILKKEGSSAFVPSIGLAREDLQYLFGPELAEQFHKFHRDHNEQLLQHSLQITQSKFPENEQEHSLVNVALWKEIVPRLSDDMLKKTSPGLMPTRVLIPMRDIMDTERRSRGIGTEGRLRDGFYYFEWQIILSELCQRAGKAWDTAFFSPLLDHLIDCGAVVPIYIVAEDGSLGRAFRFGEGIDRPLKLNYFLSNVIGHLQKRGRQERLISNNLPRILFEKTIVAMEPLISRNIPWHAQPHFNVTKEFEKFGARLIVHDYSSCYDLRAWGLENGILARAEEDTGDELRDGYTFALESLDEYAGVGDREFDAKILAPAKSIVELVLFLSSKVEPRKRGREANLKRILLALTTCGTEEDTHNAVKGELEIWLGLKSGERYALKSYRSFLANLRTLAKLDSQSSSAMDNYISTVKQVLEKHIAVLPAEAEFKTDLFYYHMENLLSWIGRQLAEVPVYRTIWDTHFQGSFNSSLSPSKKIDRIRLEGFTKLIKTISSLSRTLMNELDYWPDSRKEEKKYDENRELKNCAYYIRRYNKERKELIGQDYTMNPVSLPEGLIEELHALPSRPSKTRFFVSEMSKVFESLREVYAASFPLPSPVEEIRTEYPDVTMVMYDIKKSSDEHRDDESARRYGKLNQVVADYGKTLNDEFLNKSLSEPVTDDRRPFLVESPLNAIKLAAYLAEKSASLGLQFFLRIGIYDSKGKVPIVTLLTQRHLKHSDLFAITERIMNCKDHVYRGYPLVEEKNNDSDIFLDLATKESLLNCRDPNKPREEHFSWVTTIKPKGEALPEIIEVWRFEPVKTAIAEQLSLIPDETSE